jgi:uroporphyrinogen decarboxylase
METIRVLRRELEGRVPLIGFTGAPFTLASYMVEGKTSKQFIEIKTLMFHEPKIMHNLLDKVARAVTLYLNAQIEAGAQAVQIFDSWAGCLSPRDFSEFVVPYIQQVVEGLKGAGVKTGGVPVIYFAQGNPAILDLAKQTGCDVIGVDWRIGLDKARQVLGNDVAVQGNLDPTALFLPPEKIRERVKEVLNQAGAEPGHIFNLGHGILPPTPVSHAKALVEAVHELSKKES